MSQNTSHAVMAQRIEPHDSLDFFPTPPWATRALCEWLKKRWPIHEQMVWDPACGDGAMARPLKEYFRYTVQSDVHDYGGFEDDPERCVADFLFPRGGGLPASQWIITNPPFRLGCDFALTAMERAQIGVALLVRTAFLESVGRYEKLFSRHRPTVLQFTERVPMVKGRLDAKISTATAYCWLIWEHPYGALPRRMDWIAPCRRALEKPDDYGSAA